MSNKTPKKWKPEFDEALKLHMQGLSWSEIGRQLGKERSRLNALVDMPEFKRRKAIMEQGTHERVRKEFDSYAVDAVAKIIEIAKNGKPDQRVQLDAAKEILYQIGCKPKEVVETITRAYTIEEVTSARNTFAEVEQMMGRLSTKKSKFVLVQKSEESSNPPGEDVGAVETGNAGQETVPEKPVLPM